MGKTLAESAADILRNSAVSNQEPFGAGKNPQAYAPQPQAGNEVMGGNTTRDTSGSGVLRATQLTRPAQPPGVVGLDRGENPSGPGPVQNPGSLNAQEITPQDDELDLLDTGDDDSETENEQMEEEAFEADTTKSPGDYSANEMQDPLANGPDSQNSPQIPNVTDNGVPAAVAAYVGQHGASGGLAEDINAMFSGTKLSAAFKQKAAKIYEAAVIATSTAVVQEIAEAIESQYVEQLETVTEGLKNQLAEQVDGYLNYMVEEWVKDNEVAIEKGIRAEISEEFIAGLRKLFVEHYIDIPEDKVPVVEELAAEVQSLESRLSEEIERNVTITRQLMETRKNDALRSVCEGLTSTQADKIAKLSESVNANDFSEYKNALSMLRENYYPTGNKVPNKPAPQQLDEESVAGDERGVVEASDDDLIRASVRAIGKTKN